MRPEFRPDFVTMQTDTDDYSDVDFALKHFPDIHLVC